MKIQNLKTTDLAEIVNCLVRAFDGYFVKMPDDVAYWDTRFKGARVDYGLSYGVFDKGELVAFIINGIDEHDGKRAAFNTGTGVIETHRGQQLIDKIYTYALPQLQAAGIEKCMLDVIQANARAIRVYERIGFSIKRNFLCFKGTMTLPEEAEVVVKEVAIQALLKRENPNHFYYSWDDTDVAILSSGGVYKGYLVQNEKGHTLGHFVLNPKNNYVAQLEAAPTHFLNVMNGLNEIANTVRMNNVDERRTDYIEQLLSSGLENHINQYEMEMLI